MRKTLVATCVAVFLSSGFVGCKTASKMAWWKTADKSSIESSALAHSAPALPADIAKQAEALASSEPAIETSGGQASPYSAAGTAPSYASSTPPAAKNYPMTGASPYSAASTPPAITSTPPAIASTPPAMSSVATRTSPAVQSGESVSDLGAVDMPYNPNLVPPAKTIAAAAAPAPAPNAPADRYGAATLANAAAAYQGATTPPVATSTPPQQSLGQQAPITDRYANVQPSITPEASTKSSPANDSLASSGTTNPAGMASAYNVATPKTTPAPPAKNFMGDRYAASSLSTPPTSLSSQAPSATPAESSTPSATNSGASLASSPAFRPGGTASYNGPSNGAPSYEVASRPEPPKEEVPNVAAPDTPAANQAPQTRYR